MVTLIWSMDRRNDWRYGGTLHNIKFILPTANFKANRKAAIRNYAQPEIEKIVCILFFFMV